MIFFRKYRPNCTSTTRHYQFTFNSLTLTLSHTLTNLNFLTMSSSDSFACTKMCLNYKIGCTYPNCTFAHSMEQLVPRKCNYGDNCRMKSKCWYLHPSDVSPTPEELFRDATIGIKFNEVPAALEIKNLPEEINETVKISDKDVLCKDVLDLFQKTNDEGLLELLEDIDDMDSNDDEIIDEAIQMNDDDNMNLYHEENMMSEIYQQRCMIEQMNQEIFFLRQFAPIF